MTLKYIKNEEYKREIEKLYLESFPKEERFPFWILEECSKEDKSDLLAVLDNDKFIGMCYLVNCNEVYYLMYLAVAPELRNQNYGSKILTDLKEKYKALFLMDFMIQISIMKILVLIMKYYAQILNMK